MSDNDIKKALECCSYGSEFKCQECPADDFSLSCGNKLAKQALDLINRLEAEIERYQHIKETVDGFWSEIQKLSMFKGKDKPTLEELLEYIEQVKSEAIKEFWSKLVAKYESVNGQYVDRAMNRIAKDTIKELTEKDFKE